MNEAGRLADELESLRAELAVALGHKMKEREAAQAAQAQVADLKAELEATRLQLAKAQRQPDPYTTDVADVEKIRADRRWLTNELLAAQHDRRFAEAELERVLTRALQKIEAELKRLRVEEQKKGRR